MVNSAYARITGVPIERSGEMTLYEFATDPEDNAMELGFPLLRRSATVHHRDGQLVIEHLSNEVTLDGAAATLRAGCKAFVRNVMDG